MRLRSEQVLAITKAWVVQEEQLVQGWRLSRWAGELEKQPVPVWSCYKVCEMGYS